MVQHHFIVGLSGSQSLMSTSFIVLQSNMYERYPIHDKIEIIGRENARDQIIKKESIDVNNETYKKWEMEARGVTQLLKHMFCVCEDLSVNLANA